MAKKKLAAEEKFEKQDFDLFEALAAIDKKDYSYYDRLTEEQKKDFLPYMMIQWASGVKGKTEIEQCYVLAVNEFANKHFFNEAIQRNPKLQWLMLCACSPGLGKQFHQWIPSIPQSVRKLKSEAKEKDIKEYYKKIYSKVDDETLTEVAKLFVQQQKKKVKLAKIYPNMKLEDIDILSKYITEENIAQYEKDSGN